MKILNLTRKYYISFNQALRGMENCAFAWVETGKTVRDLSLAESIAKRNEQAKNAEPLAYAEVAGLTFKGPIPNDFNLIRQAHEFCAMGPTDRAYRSMPEVTPGDYSFIRTPDTEADSFSTRSEYGSVNGVSLATMPANAV